MKSNRMKILHLFIAIVFLATAFTSITIEKGPPTGLATSTPTVHVPELTMMWIFTVLVVLSIGAIIGIGGFTHGRH